jgi:hypothetical protein
MPASLLGVALIITITRIALLQVRQNRTNKKLHESIQHPHESLHELLHHASLLELLQLCHDCGRRNTAFAAGASLGFATPKSQCNTSFSCLLCHTKNEILEKFRKLPSMGSRM